MSPARPADGRSAAVIGHPVRHSLSPVMHRAAYAALGLVGWQYDAVDVDEPDLPDFLASLDSTWVGLSVTMPLKRAVRPFLVHESDLAAQVGAVNTVTLGLDESGVAARRGYNTDVFGIIEALAEVGVREVSHALVLGGGATAASALAALRDLGCTQPVVLLRSPERGGPLLDAAQRLAVRPRLARLDVDTVAVEAAAVRVPGGVVVSTLPAGAGDPFVDVLVSAALAPVATPSADTSPGQAPALLDVLYDPWPTDLAQSWRSAGGAAVGGFSMLVHQAEGQVRLMTGQRPDLDVMRAAGHGELARRSASHPAAVTPGG